MKKILISLFVVLLIIVLVSPGVVGKIAENSMNQQLGWATSEASNGELVVRSDSFDSSWFTSQGVHYVSLGQGNLRKTLMDDLGLLDPDSLPRLRQDTHIDHGLVPVSSLQREGGSLAPALGSARSTMQLELTDDDSFDVPGAIFTKLGLGGGLNSEYVLPAGSFADEDSTVQWDDSRLGVQASPSSGRVVATGDIPGFTVESTDENVGVGPISFRLDQKPGPSGLYVGEFDMEMTSMQISGAATPPINIGPFTMTSSSAEDDNKVGQTVAMALKIPNAPMLGDMAFDLQMDVLGVDATALKNLSDTANSMDDTLPPDAIFALLEEDLVALTAGGFAINIDQLDLSLPQGLVDGSMRITVPESDIGTFSWANTMQAATGEASLSIPAMLVQLATMASPEANMLITMGFLQQDGDVYKMDAEYAKGLLTVNGNPLPLPMPSR